MSTAQAVFKQLKDDFPSQDAKWVLASDVSWSQLTSVPLDKIDFANEKQWNAYEHAAKLKRFVQKIKRGDRKPVILARVKDNPKLVVLDGHHRSLAHKQLSMPVRAYIATISGKSEEAALEMHAAQNKGNSGPKVQKFSNELLFTPMTGVSSTVQHPFAKKPKPGLWGVPGMQLAPYVQNVAHALLRTGRAKTRSEAIHRAYGIVQNWAQGKGRNGKHVHPDVQAAAGRNIAQMDAKRMKAHMKHQTSLSNDHSIAPDFHKLPAAMRRYRKALESKGVPKDQSLKQTVTAFKKLQSSQNPLLKEASKGILQNMRKRKGKITNNGEAGGDTGVRYKQMKMSRVDDFANMHHDGFGKFTDKPRERERILREFQEANNLEVTGTMDSSTRTLLQTMNKAASE